MWRVCGFALSAIRGWSAPAPQPDWKATLDEAVQILSGFIKLDTSNPPGNEIKGAQYLKAFLDGAGIPPEIVELEPGRGNPITRIKGLLDMANSSNSCSH